MRVGIVGAGWWASQHALALRSLPGFRVGAVYQPRLEAARRFTDEFGGRAVPELDALLHDPQLDAVLIAAPHHEHLPLALRTLEAGKPVLLEKPPAISAGQMRQLQEALARTALPCLVGFTSHYFPGFQAARALLTRGELGRPLAGQSVFQKLWMEANRRRWHLDRAQGGGMLLTAGIHALDRLLWLMDRRVEGVSATLGSHLHDQQADDLASLFLRLEGGASGLVGSYGYAQGGPINSTQLLCERGALRVSADRLEVATAGEWQPLPLDLPPDLTLHALAQAWLDLAAWQREGRPPQVTLDFVGELMAVVFAAEASARTQREVALTDA